MKAPEAFRSISEVAATLGVPQHTLRAWETRFPFVKPVKRSDGRRYYRPADVEMLTELYRLLTEEGRSTADILRLGRAGLLKSPSFTEIPAHGGLQHHLAILTAARERLKAALG